MARADTISNHQVLDTTIQDRKRVALIFWPKVGNQHQFMQGIRQFTTGFSHWMCKGLVPDNGAIPALLAWQPHGIIGMIETPEIAATGKKLRVPIVDVADRLIANPCLLVGVDHQKVGMMAANYFLERKFRHFAFCGVAGTRFSIERHRGFANVLRNEAITCEIFWHRPAAAIPRKFSAWVETNAKLARWLRGLPKPLAVFASDDQTGLVILSSCFEAGIRVPDEVAVLGVDDDELMCTLANPPLSSIPLPSKRIGYEAAAQLEAMMADETRPRSPIVLPPLPVVGRSSTDRLVSADPDVHQALLLIQANLRRNLRVAMIATHLAVSRRSLERKFRRELSTGIQEQIWLARVQAARKLLAETDLSMSVIAVQSGFTNAARFSVVFRRSAGFTPMAYRKLVRNT